MSCKKVVYAGGRVSTVVLFCLMVSSAAMAATYTVKKDGTGNFTTVQACANAVRAGDTCLVSPGTYQEHVQTAAGGASETARVFFKAQAGVIIQGINIRHPYVTVDGFTMTGDIPGTTGMITVFSGGSNCQILNNVLRDGALRVPGIYFYSTNGQAASSCIVRSNRLSNLRYVFITTDGNNHRFEENTLEFQNSQDYLRLFGTNHVFRRNIFWRGTELANTGNHPDFVQNFGTSFTRSENHLFEENWIQDLPSQFSQLNSGDGQVSNAIMYGNLRDITFRRNVIINVTLNANVGIPGVRFENNTFYRMSNLAIGLIFGGSLTRGDAPRATLRNNVFLAGGARASDVNGTTGFYSMSGSVLTKEVVTLLVTKEKDTFAGPIAVGIHNDLVARGYIGPNGNVLAKGKALTDISQFVLSGTYGVYRTGTYDVLRRTSQLDDAMRNSFSADYNFVAGAAAANFPAKRTSNCDFQKTSTDFNFCEARGINGGNPRLASLTNLLGLDGIPFTRDDGLKPTTGSPLCGKGAGGVDIGAYSCDPLRVFAAAAP